MKVPLSWLKEYVDIVVPPEELARRLTMAGTEVAEVATIGGWTGCTVGLVTKVEPHPNADRLTLCTVDTGGGSMTVVCGAPNVAEGQKIAFAGVGAELYNRHSGKVEPLTAAKIRGVVSEGMVCSEKELGLGENHAGILVLPEDAPLGAPLSDYLGDHVLDLEVTPNRPDCLSVLGVAHEVAATTGTSVREPGLSYTEGGDSIESQVSVEIADPDLCRRYTASLVTGVLVGPSPSWMQDRLLKAGMRPINNVVDVTNYVMLEYNQPLHAFDFQTVKGGKIIVRRARAGEVLVSLDGVERELSADMLVIADARDPVGLAGVIGGARSEMTERSTTVLLESATFDAVNNRRTAQAFRLSTEASNRFEKSLRPELAPLALRRATQLLCQVAGGTAARGILDVFPSRQEYDAPTLTFTLARLRKVLGIDLPLERVEGVFGSLGLPSERLDGDRLRVTVPYWRSDITIEDDLVEEVARIVGYDEVPTTMLSTPIPHHEPQPLPVLKDRVKDILAASGLQEVITYPATTLEDLGRAAPGDDGREPLKLANPMSPRQGYLRTSLRSSLLSTLAANQPHEEGPVAIFESGRTYLPRNGDLPEEREMVAGVLSGPRWGPHWLSQRGDMDFYDAKGIVERLLEELGLTIALEPAQDAALHPGRCARILSGEVSLGLLGEVHPSVVEGFEIGGGPVALFELDLEAVQAALIGEDRSYRPIGRYPSALRDLSVLVPRDIPAATVQSLIEGHDLVTEAFLFDVYSGDAVPAGKRSLAYNIYFQSPDRTLTAEEVNRVLDAVVGSLEREFGAELRG